MKKIIPWALMVLGLCLTGVGIYMGEDTVIWRKAIMICMECIGLG